MAPRESLAGSQSAGQCNAAEKRLVEGASKLFLDQRRRELQDQDALVAELYKQIGRLQMELDWLKKGSSRNFGDE